MLETDDSHAQTKGQKKLQEELVVAHWEQHGEEIAQVCLKLRILVI